MRSFYSFIFCTIFILTHSIQAQPMESKLLKNYASYNTWANEQLINWLKTADPTLLQKEIESSFNSLEKTAQHLWGAEYGWLSTLKNEPWAKTPEVKDVQELFSAFLATSKQFEAYVHSLSNEEIASTRQVGDKSMQVSDIILHVFNHASYHRGQLITMGRQAGLAQPPRTDYVYYLRVL